MTSCAKGIVAGVNVTSFAEVRREGRGAGVLGNFWRGLSVHPKLFV
jgi:hypothetical protein